MTSNTPGQLHELLPLRRALPARRARHLHPAGSLAAKSRAGLTPSANATDNAKFSKSFWWSAKTFGRTDERLVTARYYFALRPQGEAGSGRWKISKSRSTSSGKAACTLTLPHKIKGRKGLKAILAKAREIEQRH